MKKFISSKSYIRLIGFILFLGVWQLLSLFIGEQTFIFPGPFETISEVVKMLGSSYIYECIYNTMLRMMIGFGISFLMALIIGVLAGNYEVIEELLRPTVSVFKSVPTASLVYLFLVIAGAKTTPLFIVVLVSFPILYESVVGGIKSTPSMLLEAARLDGTGFLKINTHIRIPLAKPYILVGLASSFGLALKIEIMAEVITGYTRLGLGSAIMAAQRSDPTNMVPVFAYSFVTISLVIIMDSLASFIKAKYGKK